MSLPRLPFLYPHLFKPSLLHESSLALHPIRTPPKHIHRACFSNSQRRRQETYAQRYGKATEPQIAPPTSQKPSEALEDETLAGAIEKEVTSPAKQERKKAESQPAKEREKTAQPSKQEDSSSREEAISIALRDPGKRAQELNAANSTTNAEASTSKEGPPTTVPLSTIFEMPAPTVEKPEEHKAPHLQAPPYVHHFNTYSLVKDLERGGFTEEQSVTIMKAVRSLLAVNLDVAKEGLVSKSDVENETYLFRAACSELRTEILNLRKSSSSKTHTHLSHLQHNFDILSQRVSQETLTLRDDLKGMLNDRRMATRMQQQSRDSEISELNYKISVMLNSGSKSEVEGLRWVLTRRAAIAIAVMAVLILGSLRYSSYKIHENERESEVRRAGGREGGGEGRAYTVSTREVGTQVEGEGAGGGDGSGAVGAKGEGVGYVSLG